MKKYLIALLTIIIMTTVTSAVNAGLSPQCMTTLETAVKDLEGITLQQALDDKTGETWKNFKNDARSKGRWDGIVQSCVSPLRKYKCRGCQCGENDECTSHCLCCWGDERC